MSAQINFNDVSRTYNGKQGCMCGCLGRYTSPEHIDIDKENAREGWRMHREEDVSNRRAKIAVSKVNKALVMSEDELDDNGIDVMVSDNFPGKGSWASIGCNGRTTAVYLK